MDEIDVLGLPVPNAGPVFLAALVVHVSAGLACVACGALAALSRKGGTWHLRFGRAYLWGLGVLLASVSVLAAIRWRENAHLAAIGVVAAAAALIGYLNRQRRPILHIVGLGLSYVTLLTGFYVDNGPHLPLWDRLPAWAHWLVPSLVGFPLIARAVRSRLRRKAAAG
ncbi:hypothetical protein ACFSKW_05275 [Nonomuraea mangrovi]|uniref:DUF2306 domain-containing protein n=1 Tax=Nonomuraea mangrovi TaxID=2316207 RepID=A0ABW4SPJ9_9ACTN